MDFTGPIQRHMLLVIIDARCKWMEVHVMTTSSAKAPIENLQITIPQLGLPTTVVSDNRLVLLVKNSNSF